MISEKKLVVSHTSFWRSILPMADSFTRMMNSHARPFADPYPSTFPPQRNAGISELAFRLFDASGEFPPELVADDVVDHPLTIRLAANTRKYIGKLDGSIEEGGITREERIEAARLWSRLSRHFRDNEGGYPIVTRPKFIGCGFVDDCEGDILAGTVLYEIKNVERDFRLVDVRQLLAYVALNSAAPRHRIEAVALLNARSGKFFRMRLNSLALAVAGVPASELLSGIVDYLTSDRPYS
jgi:hypothetical protein